MCVPLRASLTDVAYDQLVDGESACRRDSVIRYGSVAIHLSGPPGDIDRAGRPTLDLAPGGVYRAAQVTLGAGALLPHRCTLTCDARRRPSAVCFLWHCPSSHLDWPLASTLPCGVPTFLDRVGPGRGHPTDSPSGPVCQIRPWPFSGTFLHL